MLVKIVDKKENSDLLRLLANIAREVRHLIFPRPLHTAGAPFSDQWWKVYKRAVFVGLLLVGLILVKPPTFNNENPDTRQELSQNTTIGQVDASKSTANGTGTTAPAEIRPIPKIDPSLAPMPNPHPLVIAATPEADMFLLALFQAIKESRLTNNLIKQPPSPAVSAMLGVSHAATPSQQLPPPDALTVLKRDDGNATVRVKEQYFTGEQKTSDYVLVSDSGSWELADIQPASNLRSAGDPISFVFHQFSLIGQQKFHPVYDNFDSDLSNKKSYSDFSDQFAWGWVVPDVSTFKQAFIVQSLAPDNANPETATVKVVTSYLTSANKPKTSDGQPLDLLIDLVNVDGQWHIHDIRQTPATNTPG